MFLSGKADSGQRFIDHIMPRRAGTCARMVRIMAHAGHLPRAALKRLFVEVVG